MKKILIVSATLLLVSGNVLAKDPTRVEEQNLDADGNIAVHEQGEVAVWEQNVDREGNIKVHEQGVADVKVTNEIQAELTGGEVDVNVKTPKSYRFVGFSSGEFEGDVGVFPFTWACQSDYGRAARMCNTVEVMETVNIPGSMINMNPWTRAWVRPIVVGDGTRDASGTMHHRVSHADSLSCNGWSEKFVEDQDYPAYVGMTVSWRGHFKVMDCRSLLHVACCSNTPQRINID